MQLNPTLWRTCRVLAGPTRLRLLRLILAKPGATVSRLAADAGIGLSRASQELRRLQSRGLVGVKRHQSFVHYVPTPDPQVSSARPLLLALQAAFARGGRAQDETIRHLAAALSHPRRILLLRELSNGPRSLPMLQSSLDLPYLAALRHLHGLEKGGLVRHRSRLFRLARNAHPLARCLVTLATGPK